jgi:hypothetical protein
VSRVNEQLLSLWRNGKAEMEERDCDEAEPIVARIKQLMTVPLVQGTLRYVLMADPAVSPVSAKVHYPLSNFNFNLF